MSDPRPIEILNHFYDKELFSRIYFFAEHKGEDDVLQWPDWCFVPLPAVYAAIQPEGQIDPHKGALIGTIGALAAWRVSKGIYRFDPEVLEELWRTELDETIDESVLYHLPEFCCYIETPGKTFFDEQLHGFFVHLEYDVNAKRPDLRLLLDRGPIPIPMPFPVHLGYGSIVEGIKRSLAQGALYSPNAEPMPVHASELIFEELSGIISLVLYLCTANADISGEKPTRYRMKRTKRGPRVFGADHVRTWDVAVRLGAALRSARVRYERDPEAAGTGSPKRPHIRRAHFHTYHTGAGRVDSILKWLPPIAVNVDDWDEVVPVIRAVDKKS